MGHMGNMGSVECAGLTTTKRNHFALDPGDVDPPRVVAGVVGSVGLGVVHLSVN